MGVQSIEHLVETIKAELFSPSTNLHSFLPCPSAYDTAWVAMVPHPQRPDRPMSPGCLDWILENQWDRGFWGEPDRLRRPTVECITATLACLVALKTWNVGSQNIKEGQGFLHSNMESLLVKYQPENMEWFALVFPGMLELAQSKGLEVLPDGYTDAVNHVFLQRSRILEIMMDDSSLLGTKLRLELYYEVLPASYKTKHEVMAREGGEDGLVMFRSPSAAASAFMATGDEGYMHSLQTMLHSRGQGAHGVPWMHPIDEDLIKLCLVDHLERLGCADHFSKEIGEVMDHAHRNWVMEEENCRGKHDAWMQIYKDAMSFRLLRMHGYPVSPRRFCWFVHDEDMLSHMEENYSYYSGAMYSVYRASHFSFPREDDLEKAKVFSRKILEKGLPSDHYSRDDNQTLMDFQIEIESELRIPWLARLDHLEHRKYIEMNRGYALWLGKASACRLSITDNALQLSKENFMLRQSIYRTELKELMRWSKDAYLSSMGFGREKTTYCYFAVATTSCLRFTSDARKVIAKGAILVTVADDFFDEKGLMDELYILTEAVKRWNGEDLHGHSKVIFDALDDLVSDITLIIINQQGYNVKKILQQIWYETFESWLKEAEWSRSGEVPSTDEYLRVGMISIGIQAMVLPACYMMSKELPEFSINSYSSITKLVMVSTRLLNDIQSYQREEKDGKINMVLLYLKENTNKDIEGSLAYIKNLLDQNEKEVLALVLSNEYTYIPKKWKELHLSSLKVFQMLFNSGNKFDSPTSLLEDIHLSIYDSLAIEDQSLVLECPPHSYAWKKKKRVIVQFRNHASHNFSPIKAEVGHRRVSFSITHHSRMRSFEVKQSFNFVGPKFCKVFPTHILKQSLL